MEYYELIRITADTPEGSDFCIIAESAEMEPLIPKGGKIYVSRRESPGDMELGIFYYKGQVFCRQYCEDYAGDIHLLCANPAYESANLRIPKSEAARCLCLGKVLLKEKPPMPLY